MAQMVKRTTRKQPDLNRRNLKRISSTGQQKEGTTAKKDKPTVKLSPQMEPRVQTKEEERRIDHRLRQRVSCPPNPRATW